MGYRERTAADERWTTPRETVSEGSLPSFCHETFAAFEKLFDYQGVMSLPEEQRPAFIELPAEGSPEVYFPEYDQVKPSFFVSLGGAGCMTVAIFVVVGVAVAIVEAIAGTGLVTNVLWGIGGVAVLATQLWWWWTELRDRKRIRDHPRSLAFGTYLLGDAVVQRYLSRCHYYPRACIQEVYEEEFPSKSGSSYMPYFRYVDGRGRLRKTSMGLGRVQRSEGESTQRIRRWLRETQPGEPKGRRLPRVAAGRDASR